MRTQKSAMTKQIFLFMCVILLLPALVKADMYFQPGVTCKYYDPQGLDTYFDPGGHKANGLKNVGSSTKYVTCPLVWNPLRSALMGIYIRSSAASCSVYTTENAEDMDAGEYDVIPLNLVDNLGEGVYFYTPSRVISFGDSASIYCGIPAGGIINGYVIEYDN